MAVFKSISALVVSILLQIVIFRFAVFSEGWIIICFQLYGIVLLPINLHKTNYLILSALIGAVLDFIFLTGGIHLAAGAFLGFLLPFISSVIAPRDGFIKGHMISALKDGWFRFLSYSFLISFTYFLALFIFEGARLSLIFSSIGKAFLSAIFNTVLIGVAQGLFGLKRKSKKSKVSAYPWS